MKLYRKSETSLIQPKPGSLQYPVSVSSHYVTPGKDM
jgi:hypothetical protein